MAAAADVASSSIPGPAALVVRTVEPAAPAAPAAAPGAPAAALRAAIPVAASSAATPAAPVLALPAEELPAAAPGPAKPTHVGQLARSKPVDVLCMAAADASCNFKPRALQRRPVGAHDVLIDLRYCGICHTDLHCAAGQAPVLGDVIGMAAPGETALVPGHELAGVCVAVGERVTLVKVGDHVGVGNVAGSCLECAACKSGHEEICSKSSNTYGARDKSGINETYPLGSFTLGGYSSATVVHERFCIIAPKSYPLECVGPVMCAGVTVFNPLVAYGAGQGTRVGVVALGGLGQMAVKMAKAMGCIVTVVTSTPSKAVFARECGAEYVIVSSSAAEMEAARKVRSLDLIIDTSCVDHDVFVLMKLLARGGKYVQIGVTASWVATFMLGAMVGGKGSSLRSSMIGGISMTQEAINFCAKHNIRPTIELINVEGINKAFELLSNNSHGGVRFVIDLKNGGLKSFEEASERCYGVPAPKLREVPEAELVEANRAFSLMCRYICSCWCFW